jgi:hypothetical protein
MHIKTSMSEETSIPSSDSSVLSGFGQKNKKRTNLTLALNYTLLFTVLVASGFIALQISDYSLVPPTAHHESPQTTIPDALAHISDQQSVPSEVLSPQLEVDSLHAQALKPQAELLAGGADKVSPTAVSLPLRINSAMPILPMTVDQQLAAISSTNVDLKAKLDEQRKISSELIARMEKTEAALDSLERKPKQVVTPVSATPKVIKQAPSTTSQVGAPPLAQSKADDSVALTILDINAARVVVVDAQQKIHTVMAGGNLPGGAVFIAFEGRTRTMRTDVGDFTVP